MGVNSVSWEGVGGDSRRFDCVGVSGQRVRKTMKNLATGKAGMYTTDCAQSERPDPCLSPYQIFAGAALASERPRLPLMEQPDGFHQRRFLQIPENQSSDECITTHRSATKRGVSRVWPHVPLRERGMTLNFSRWKGKRAMRVRLTTVQEIRQSGHTIGRAPLLARTGLE